MGGSKVQPTGSTRKLLPRTQSTSNLSKAAYIKQEIEQDVSQDESNNHLLYFQSLTVFMVLVPQLQLLVRQVREKITQLLFDFNILRKLEDAHVINWCSAARKLYPLWTKGDGNCLPHAVSLYLWGVHDENLFLRRLIHKTLTDPATSNHFQTRWKHTKHYTNSTIPEGGVQYDSHEWDREWAMVVDLASDTRQDNDPNSLPFKSLEEVHIFVLANVIRRPIIVLSEGVVRRMDGSSLAPNDIGGIYLPTLCNSKDCTKSPVILCYDSNHFVPLLSMEIPKQASSPSEHVVPIVASNLGNLPVHFLSDAEESQVTQLLETYLNLVEVRWIKSDHVDEVLSVAIHKRKLPDDLNLMDDFCAAIERDILCEQQNRVIQKEVNQNITTKTHEEQDPPYRRVGGSFRPNPGGKETLPSFPGPSKPEAGTVGAVEESVTSLTSIPLAVEAHRLAALESQPCVTPGCQFHGLPENGDRCSVCVKEYTKHKQGSKDDETAARFPQKAPSPVKSGEPIQRTSSYREKAFSTGSEEPRSFPLFPETPVEYSKCIFPGCDFLASRSTLPYCINHHPKGTIISTVRESKDRHSGGISSYYARQVTPESSPEPRHESHSLESVQVHFPKKCIIGRCLEYGDPEKMNMCSFHYQDYNSSQQTEKKSEKKISFATNTEASASVIDRSKKGGPVKNINLILCQNMRCAQRGVPSLQGYCRECYQRLDIVQNQQNEQQQNIMEQFGHKPMARPKSWAPTPNNAKLVDQLIDIGQTSEFTGNKILEDLTPQNKPSNLSPLEQVQQRVKRIHEPSVLGQQEMPEKTRRTYNSALPQFSQYREPQESLEDIIEPLPCLTEGCCGVQLRDCRGYCFRCSQRRSQSVPRSPSPIVSLTNVGDPPLEHSSSVGQNPNVGSTTPSEENTSYEREMQNLPKCRFTACDNRGLDINNGLCQVCFDLLASQRRTNQPKPMVSVISPTSIFIPPTSGTSGSSGFVARRHCKALGCAMYGTPETDNYCSQCFAKTRSGFQEERQRDYGRWHSSDITPAERKSVSEPLSPSITASPCRDHHCTKFGDPAFNGFCSACYTRYGYRHGQTHDIPVSYTPVFPSFSRTQYDGADYNSERSFHSSRPNISKCRNYILQGCSSYGNPNCRGYCNSCYIRGRSSMY